MSADMIALSIGSGGLVIWFIKGLIQRTMENDREHYIQANVNNVNRIIGDYEIKLEMKDLEIRMLRKGG